MTHPPFYTRVSARYADVLEGLPSDVRIAVLKDLKRFKEGISSKAWGLLISLPTPLQLSFLKDLFSKKPAYHLSSQNFLTLLCHYRRLSLLPGLLAFLHYRLNKETHQETFLIAAQPLSEKEKESLEKRLSKIFMKKTTVQADVDPSLLSGGILIWDTFSLDASLKHLFFQLKKGITDDTLLA